MDLLTQLENLTADLNGAATLLTEHAAAWEVEEKALVAATRQKYLGRARELVGMVAQRRAQALALVTAHRAEFHQPKSRELNNWLCGWRKGAGAVVFEDADRVILLIKAKLKPKSELLIKTTEELRKKALKDLQVDELAKIGCTLETTDDVPFVRPVDSAVAKTIDAIGQAAAETAAAETAAAETAANP